MAEDCLSMDIIDMNGDITIRCHGVQVALKVARPHFDNVVEILQIVDDAQLESPRKAYPSS